jgi:hypothetical protein
MKGTYYEWNVWRRCSCESVSVHLMDVKAYIISQYCELYKHCNQRLY